MGKVRVYELAKELNLGNKELVLKLQEMGYPVKSHSSTIEDFLLREIRERLKAPGAKVPELPKGDKPKVILRRRKASEPEQAEPTDSEVASQTTFPEPVSEASFPRPVFPEIDDHKEEAVVVSESSHGPAEGIEPVTVEPIEAEEKKEVVDTKVEAVAIEVHPEEFAEKPVKMPSKTSVEEVVTKKPAMEVSSGSQTTVVTTTEEAVEKPVMETAEKAMVKPADEPIPVQPPAGRDEAVEAHAPQPTDEKSASTLTTTPEEPTQPERPQSVESTSALLGKADELQAETAEEKAEASDDGDDKADLRDKKVDAAKQKKRKRKKLKKIEKTTAEPAKIISRPTTDQPFPHLSAAQLIAQEEKQKAETAPPRPAPPRQPQAAAAPPRGEAPARPAPRFDRERDRDKGPDRDRERPRDRERKPFPPRVPSAPAAFDVGKSEFGEKSLEARKSKKKKKGKEFTAPATGEDFARKKGFRRKEIIEKAELYEKNGWDRPSRGRKSAKSPKKIKKTEITTPKAIKRRIKVTDAISVSDLSKKMGIKAGDIIKKLMSMGVMANLNQALDYDTASLVATEFDYEVEKGAFDEEVLLDIKERAESKKEYRPPVVTVMGHVDHGKTSLLDAIRHTDVIGGEAGGITQHIGAYHVSVDGGTLTFLDTPGHEAFTSMRARGAKVTDIVVLVVAADDGVMQQTREAADHAKAAEVPIIIAVNKIDKPEANPERIRRELADIGIVPEAWGGDTIFVDLSAKSGEGIDDLIEMILLQSEVLELKATTEGRATGHIIEARLDKGRGPVATVLVHEGTLKTGDPFVCGVWNGKIRAMFDDKGNRVDEAGPSIPVEIQGIGGVPSAGDEFVVVEDEKTAKQISSHRQLKQRETELIKTSRLTLENLFDSIKEGATKELKLVLKADVQGSLEAITEALHKLDTEEIKISLLRSSTGAITETDIILASASGGLVIGFNVRPNSKVVELAEQEGIQIRFYDVIYKLIDEVRDAMAGMLAPIQQEHVMGRAEVRDVFHIAKIGSIAGSHVIDGKIQRGANARLLRDDVVIYDGKIGSLKRFKEDAREVVQGYECGIGLENYNDIKMGDVVEAYTIEEVAATL